MGIIRIFLVTFIFHFFLWGTATATPLTNGDFSAVPFFSGWSGELVDTGPADPDSDSHFNIDNGMAKITNGDTDWWAALYQEIDIPDSALTISFDYEWFFTDPLYGDEAQASLWSDYANNILAADLFSGVDLESTTGSGKAITDISSLAGGTLLLEFMVIDKDYNANDWLKIDNIKIAVVPEPGTMVLVAIGLLIGLMAEKSHLSYLFFFQKKLVKS